MLPVENLLSRPRDSSESTDYFFLDLQQSQVLLLVTLSLHSKVLDLLESSLCNNWNNYQVLDVNLDLDSFMCVFKGKHLSNLTRDSTHNSTKTSLRLLKHGLGFSFYTWSKTHNPTCHIGLGWFRNSIENSWSTILDRSSLIFDRSSLVEIE